MAIPGPMDAIANISVTLYGNGEMSIKGNIGDVKLALGMLDHARDAVKGQFTKRETIVLPNQDVQLKAALPLTQYADAPREWQPGLTRQMQE